ILSIAASFVAVLMLNLRTFGFAGSVTLTEAAHRYSRVLWWALAGLIGSGFLMIVGEPVRELVNPYFWVKMILLVIGVLVAVTFAKSLAKQGEATGSASGGTKVAGVV